MTNGRSAAGRRSRTPSTEVERELIAAAEAVLRRDGPARLTVRAVAAQAGIAPMGVYSRLGGKDGLIDALLVLGFDLLRAAITGGDRRGPDPLQAAGLRYRDFALANRHFYAIMFESAIPHESSSDAVTKHAAAAFDALVQIVNVAVAAGAPVIAGDPREAARQVWAVAHGAVMLELHGLAPAPDPAAAYGATLKTMLRGLTRPRQHPDLSEAQRRRQRHSGAR